MKEVLEFIKNLNISTDEPVIVACSGGPDSMFLLSVLNNLGLKVVCAHVNHNVRVESIDEYRFMENYCNEHNIIFEGTELIDAPSKDFENYARMFRYKFFEELIEKYNSKYLFTAHHGDDLIETILMRISRGSTLNGYAGFNFITDKPNYRIVRPLIYLTKEEIEEYNDNHDIPYNIDNTNFEDEHTRNRFRHKVLPFLKNENKNIHKQFIKYHNTVQSYYDYVNNLVYMNKDKMFKDNVLDLNDYKTIDKFLKDKLLCEIIRDYYPDDLYYIGSSHVNEIIKMINSDKPTLTITLPRGIKIHKEYDKLIFNFKESTHDDYFLEIKKEISTPSGNIYIVEESNDTSNFTIRLRNDKYYVRNIKQGDVMNVKNMKSKKKIKDILINEKVPLNDRKKLPVVVNSSGEIVWIPGIKKSNFDIPINGDYDIILKYVKEKKNEE